MIKEYGDPAARTVLVQPVDAKDMSVIENEISEIKRQSDKDFCLYALEIGNWNRELSPWEAPAVFGKEDFGDGAKDTLDVIRKKCADNEKHYIIGGYSLAGLFSLWAAYQTDLFAAVAAASPSLWFPGFIGYMKSHEIMTGTVYLSLGDKEERARNPVMATVGDCVREAHDLLKAQNIRILLEWNQGNHFKDTDIRTARAFAWALNESGRK